jgi:integrase
MDGRKSRSAKFFGRRRKQVRVSLTRRGKNSWRFRYDLPRARPGERERRSVTLHGTRKQAEADAAKILASLASGLHVDPSGETVATFSERWLKDWADANVSNKTFTRYEQLLRRHLCSRVGSVPIQKLRPADLQAIYAAMAKNGLADRTRLHLHRVTSTMLRHATQWGLTARNVATMVDAPRVKARELEILAPEQLKTVLASLHSPELRTIADVALGSGLRRGELLGLRRRDVDLDGAVLRVEQAVEQTKRGGIVMKAPKTRHGRRAVSLAPATVAVLREHLKVQQETRLALGLGRTPADGFVFANWDGAVRSPAWLTQAWRRAMAAAGLKGTTFHSLRHTHASTLIANGLDVLTISRRLGHGSAVITLGVYGHLFKPDDRAAAIMEKALTVGS